MPAPFYKSFQPQMNTDNHERRLREKDPCLLVAECALLPQTDSISFLGIRDPKSEHKKPHVQRDRRN
jgi:hypothetical protein